MKVIGLCGRSGSGKSTVSSFFHSLGFPIIDTDKVYHEILAEKGDCVKELSSIFGDTILDKNGFINRRALADIVFMSEEKEKRQEILNAITHKYVLSRVEQTIDQLIDEGKKTVFVDVPLLFESGFNRLCDFVVCVVADDDVRLSRLSIRDGVSEDEIRSRISSQISDIFLIEHSDFVIYNNGDLQTLFEQAATVLQKLKAGD